MSDPIRLLDDPSSPLAQSAIEAWSAERPSADARARALALSTLVSGAAAGTAAASVTGGALTGSKAIGAAGATKAAAGTSALGTSALSAGVVKGLLVGAVIAGGSASVVVVVKHMDPAPESASTPGSTSASKALRPRVRPPLKISAIATGTSSASAASPTVEGPSASVDDLPAARADAHPRVAVHAKPAEIAAAPSVSAAAELTELDDARASLRGGDAARALAMLDAFEATHPRSSLRDEAMVVRVDALLRSGDRTRAVELARAFVERSPSSPYAPRLRRIAESVAPNAAPSATPGGTLDRVVEPRTNP